MQHLSEYYICVIAAHFSSYFKTLTIRFQPPSFCQSPPRCPPVPSPLSPTVNGSVSCPSCQKIGFSLFQKDRRTSRATPPRPSYAVTSERRAAWRPSQQNLPERISRQRQQTPRILKKHRLIIQVCTRDGRGVPLFLLRLLLLFLVLHQAVQVRCCRTSLRSNHIIR